MRQPPDPQTKAVKPKVVKVNRGQSTVQDLPKPKPKVVKASPTAVVSRARQQEQGYASQGKAVQKVADQQEQARQLAEDRQHAAARHDILTAQDIQKRDAYEKAHPVGSEYAKYVPNYKQGLAKAQGGGEFGKLTGLNVKKALDNVPSDALELVTTTPSSVAKLSSTLVHHPAKVPGMLVEPYKQLYKDPKTFIEGHPVTAGLMLSPAARLPGLGLGKVARLAGKQTLARTAATLPGTALKEARTGSRDFTIRAMQARKDAKAMALPKPARDIASRPVKRTALQAKRMATGRDLGRKQWDALATNLHKDGKRRTGRPNSIEKAPETMKDGAHLTQYRYFDSEGKAVGWASLHSDGGRAVYVDPAARRQGIATKLYRAAAKDGYDIHTAGGGNTQTELGDVLNRSLHKPDRAAEVPAPVMTATQIQRQADETFAAGKTHAGRVVASAYREARRRTKGMPKAERRVAIQEHVEGARGGARNQGDQRFARQFGATAYHNEQGVLVKPKDATEGVLHPTREAASAVAEKLNAKEPTVQRGTRFYGKEPVSNEFVVKPAGDKFAVLPKVAADRLARQRTVGTSKATGAKVLRQSRGMFTRTVLPYRPTWLSGQGIEGVVRSAVAGAGPTSYLRARKVVNAMEDIKPGSGRALLERAAPGGLVGRTAGMEMTTKTLKQEFPESTVARALTDVGRSPGIKQVRQLHHAVSSFVFEKLNAKALEGVPQTALLGKALKNSPLMERSIIGLSDKAIQDAARGLQGTEHQVAAARAVERMYGKYAGFSPKQREIIMHWTPFLPWYLNSAQFLLSVLPKDHPLAAALVANAGVATEEWRKAQGLSTRGGEKLPAFMLGGYPTKGGKNITRFGHYTPFGVGSDVTGAAAGLPLPQFSGFYNALNGIDWKGHQLQHPDGTAFNQGERWLYGLTQLGESFVPLASQAQQIATSKDKTGALKKQVRLLSSTPANRALKVGPAGVPPPPSGKKGVVKLPGPPPPPSGG